MHNSYEVLRGITLPGKCGVVVSRIYNWLRVDEKIVKIKPASCVVSKQNDNDFGKFFVSVANTLAESAGVNVVIDGLETHLKTVKKEGQNTGHFVEPHQEEWGKMDVYKKEGLFSFKVADSLRLSSQKSKQKFQGYISIFECFELVYKNAVGNHTIVIDFSAIRDADEDASGRESFIETCKTIEKFGNEPTLTNYLKVLSDICSCIKRGGFRRHGALTTTLKYHSPLYEEYLNIPFGFLSHLKKGTGINEYIDIDTLTVLLEKINKGEMFLEKFLGYSQGKELYTNVCLTADTSVVTRDGHKRIGDIVNQNVEVFDGFRWIQTSFVMTNPLAEVHTLELYDGRTIRATSDHEFILANGSRRKLKHLIQGDVLKEVYQSVETGTEEKAAFEDDKPLRKSTSPFKPSSVSKIEFDTMEPVYCCFVPETNAFLLSSNILVGNCRGLGIIAGDQCLVSPVNLGMCETGTDIVKGFTEVTQFLCDVFEYQHKIQPLPDRQIAVGMCGLANLLKLHGVSYREFISELAYFNRLGSIYGYSEFIDFDFSDEFIKTHPNHEVVQTYFDRVDERKSTELVYAIAKGMFASAELGEKYNMRATLAIEPTASCSRRYKDFLGFDICPNIDPPDVIKGVGIEKRHSETGVYDENGDLITPAFFYGKYIEPASEQSAEDHFSLWVEFQKLMNATGKAHGACYEQWQILTVTGFYQWMDSPLKFMYYRRNVGTKHLEKGATISARARLQSKRDVMITESDKAACNLNDPEHCEACD